MKRIIQIMLLFLLMSGIAFGQGFLQMNVENEFLHSSDSIQYLNIYTPRLLLDTNVINIVNENTEFEGYMVFKFIKNDIYPKKSGSDMIVIESYFVKDTKDINNPERAYSFVSDHNFYSNYVSRGTWDAPLDTTNIYTLRAFKFTKSKEFNDFKKLYLKHYPENVKGNNRFLYHHLTTKIFYDSSTALLCSSNCDTIGYFMYKCSFTTAILRFIASSKSDKDRTGQLIPKTLDVILPISPLYYFEPIEESEYLNNGLIKAKWYPDYIFN